MRWHGNFHVRFCDITLWSYVNLDDPVRWSTRQGGHSIIVNIWMHSFKIYGKWSVQTNKHRYTQARNAVTLVWGSLRLAPINNKYPERTHAVVASFLHTCKVHGKYSTNLKHSQNTVPTQYNNYTLLKNWTIHLIILADAGIIWGVRVG